MEENRRMSVWNWIGSLFFPLLQLVVGLPGLFILIINFPLNSLLTWLRAIVSPIGLFFVSTLVVGGLIPVIITIKKKIDTSKYMLSRLVITIVALPMSVVFSNTPEDQWFFWAVVIVAALIYYFFRTRNRLEWVVIALSEPLSRIMFFAILLNME